MSQETLITALTILVGTFVLAYVTSFLIKFVSRRKPSRMRQVVLLIATTAKLAIMVVGIISVMGTCGVDTRPIIAALGLTGFALGFALRDAISNLLAGVMIVFYSPFDIGDEIEILGSRGRVVHTNMRYTILKTDEATHLIPNSSCFTNKIVRFNETKATHDAVSGEA